MKNDVVKMSETFGQSMNIRVEAWWGFHICGVEEEMKTKTFLISGSTHLGHSIFEEGNWDDVNKRHRDEDEGKEEDFKRFIRGVDESFERLIGLVRQQVLGSGVVVVEACKVGYMVSTFGWWWRRLWTSTWSWRLTW